MRRGFTKEERAHAKREKLPLVLIVLDLPDPKFEGKRNTVTVSGVISKETAQKVKELIFDLTVPPEEGS